MSADFELRTVTENRNRLHQGKTPRVLTQHITHLTDNPPRLLRHALSTLRSSQFYVPAQTALSREGNKTFSIIHTRASEDPKSRAGSEMYKASYA